ncbi:tRNA guanosine(34) transglycosylase Tgt [Candidatus Woesearchaeota archaeon]|nr:tRNA guanosine(34) transglycosylase Tgt [Candidatus Woesearchaeota archaeon]
MVFKIVSEQGKARLGKLKTAHGIIETPFFMPVATKAAMKHLSKDDLDNTNAIITNTLLISLKPGLEIISHFNGLHNFMSWDKVIFTDSGGFQVLSEFFYDKISESGFYFKSPYDGKVHLLTPERAIEIQNALGSDVAMALDDVPHHNSSRSISNCVKRTHEWAARCKEAHKNENQLLFGITQGSIDKKLRVKSAKFINSLDFDGIALGGLGIREEKKAMYNMIDFSLPYLNKEKPRYLMGIGSPKEIINAVDHGIDIFDSCFPTRTARHGGLFTKNGRIDILRGIYAKDKSPIEKDCTCYFCKNFSKAYLRHLLKSEVPLAFRYVSIHNVHFIQEMMKEIRKSIKKNYFDDVKKEYK